MKLLILIFFLISLTTSTIHRCNKIERNDISKTLDPVTYRNIRQNTRVKRELQPFGISLIAGNGFRTYPQAKESFILASIIWQNLLHNTQLENNITIDIDLLPLRYGVLGSTSVVNVISDCRRPDGVLPEPLSSKSGLTFPTCGRLKFDLPLNVNWEGKMNFGKAHLKSLGLYGIDEMFGISDGHIYFSSRYARDFDFTISDGITKDKTDFLSVAIHELGHLLGFRSSLDEIDYGENVFNPTILDLFRFDSSNKNFLEDKRLGNPSTDDHFFLSPGLSSYNNTKFSRGVYRGDGNQASHWKADEISGINLGIMDPSLASDVHTLISMNDIEAFRSMGYNIDISINPIVLFNYILSVRNQKFIMMSIEYVFMDTVGIQYRNEYYTCSYDKELFIWKCPYTDTSICDFRVVTSSGRISDISRVNYFNCRG